MANDMKHTPTKQTPREQRLDHERKLKQEMLDVLGDCLLLFAKDHAIDRFDWGKSFLRAQDIRELNELPGRIRATIQKAAGLAPARSKP